MVLTVSPAPAAIQASSYVSAPLVDKWRVAFATLIIAIVYVSFEPFDTSSTLPGTTGKPTGNIVNQLGFGVLGLICIGLMATQVAPVVRRAFLSLTWVLAVPVLLMSVASADNPSGALRAMLFSIIVVLAAVTALSLPRNREEMVRVIAIAVSIAVLFCYIAVFFVPAQGVHGADEFEPQHIGLWRGVYDHKNVASYVTGCFALFGMYVASNGRFLWGAAIAFFAIVFTLNAGSKTVLAVLPVAMVTALLARWVTVTPLRILVIISPVLVLNTVTIGAVLHPPLLEALRIVVPDLSYTGRTDLWTFGLEYLAQSPWSGYGFESFWNTPRVAGLEQPIELNWDVRGIVHGHNSWLDAAIAFGIPGALFLVVPIVLLPIRDFCRVPNHSPASSLAVMFLSIWLLAAMGACLESFFFRRSDPVWFSMLLAICGLRIAAHMSARR